MIYKIGKCIGCLKMGQLDDEVGKCCLDHPQRGRKWAHTASRVRNDPKFAKLVFGKIESLEAKKVFIEIFGLPDGEKPQSTVKPELTLVKQCLI